MTNTMTKKTWTGYTVNIARDGMVTLRTQSGRSTAWAGGSRRDPESAAREFLTTYTGSTLIDRRKPNEPTLTT